MKTSQQAIVTKNTSAKICIAKILVAITALLATNATYTNLYKFASAQETVTKQQQNAGIFKYGTTRLVLTGDKTGALLFNLEKKWKVYWRKNTINSLPTEIKWKNNNSKILWPVPNSFSLLGSKSYGYQGDVVIPFQMQKKQNAKTNAKVNFLVCREICLPVQENLIAEIASTKEQKKILAALKRVPQKYANYDSNISISYLPVDTNNGQSITQNIKSENKTQKTFAVKIKGKITLPKQQLLKKPQIIVEENYKNSSLFNINSIKNNNDQITFQAEGQLVNLAQKYNNEHELLVTIFDEKNIQNNYPLEFKVIAKLAPYNEAGLNSNLFKSLASSSLIGLIIIAAIGGLILNAMPCVFPVLAIKIASLNNAASTNNLKHLRQALIANAMGIVCAFLILALSIIIVRIGGQKLGWGFQFQQPVFNAILVCILVILAADATRIINIPFNTYNEKGDVKKLSLKGEFITGIIITWIATPCAAPIFGSALSAALAQKPEVIIIMFSAMGIGMATPILSAAVLPKQTARLLPKPGPWSEILRKILGAVILVVAIWVLTIFAKQVSTIAALALVATIIATIAVTNLSKINKYQKKSQKHAKIVFAIVCIIPLLFALIITDKLKSTSANTTANTQNSESTWLAFEPAKIPELITKNNIVLVNITADWCLSCKVNEKIVFQSRTVKQKMQKNYIIQMQADWTSQNNEIKQFLQKHNRYGIPFTAIFAPEKIILLPEIFSVKKFLNAIAYAEKLRTTKK